MSAPAVEDVALSAELDKLGPAVEAAQDAAPVAPTRGRKSRSGTSGAERARRAKATEGKSAPARPRAPRARKPDIAGGMANLYAMAGLAVSMVPSGPAVAGPARAAGQSITGAVGMELAAQSQALGAAWQKAAEDDPRVREALEKLLAVSTFGQIIAAHVPVVMAGMVAAGAVPASLVGFTEAEQPAGAPASSGQNTGGRP